MGTYYYLSTTSNSILRRRKNVIKQIKKLDAFPKVQETFVESTSSGGTISILSFAIIGVLILREMQYYLSPDLLFKFVPDTDIHAKLKINIDITVAMPCSAIGADILDATNQNVYSFGELKEEETWFELSPQQQNYFLTVQQVNGHLRERFHAIQDILHRSGYLYALGEMPNHHPKPNRLPDACRVHGSLELNKVAGNFHITVGKSIALPTGHVHISTFLGDGDFNFSHRINHFSFGDSAPGLIYPLEGDEKTTTTGMMNFQYIVEVVATNIRTTLSYVDTYQYSVKDKAREISHGKGSHGIPGIFFKYDVSALKLQVTEDSKSLSGFLVSLCAMVGGIYATSGIINSMVGFVVSILCCQFVRARTSSYAEPPPPYQQPLISGDFPARSSDFSPVVTPSKTTHQADL